MDFHVATVAQLSAHLRALRKARHLTQANLGRLLGVKQSRIADIESDPGSVSVSQLHKILSALGAHMLLRDSGVGGWTHTDASASVAVRRLSPSVTPSKSGQYRNTGTSKDATRASDKPPAPTRAAKKSTGSW